MAEAFALVASDVRELLRELDDIALKWLVRLVFTRFSIAGSRRGHYFDGQVTS